MDEIEKLRKEVNTVYEQQTKLETILNDMRKHADSNYQQLQDTQANLTQQFQKIKTDVHNLSERLKLVSLYHLPTCKLLIC